MSFHLYVLFLKYVPNYIFLVYIRESRIILLSIRPQIDIKMKIHRKTMKCGWFSIELNTIDARDWP